MKRVLVRHNIFVGSFCTTCAEIFVNPVKCMSMEMFVGMW